MARPVHGTLELRQKGSTGESEVVLIGTGERVLLRMHAMRRTLFVVSMDQAPIVQAAAADARQGAELRQDLEKMAEASQFLVEKKASDVMIVEVIDEISRILPDHTWIARLDLSGTELQIQGQSAASSSLIRIIESSPWFEKVRFASPVVQIAGTDKDRIHIVATVARKRADLGERPQ